MAGAAPAIRARAGPRLKVLVICGDSSAARRDANERKLNRQGAFGEMYYDVIIATHVAACIFDLGGMCTNLGGGPLKKGGWHQDL